MQCLLRSKRMPMPMPMPMLLLPPLLLLPLRPARAVTASPVSSSIYDRSYSRTFPPRTPHPPQLTQVALGVLKFNVLKPFLTCLSRVTRISAPASRLVYCAQGSVGDTSVTGHRAVHHTLPSPAFISLALLGPPAQLYFGVVTRVLYRGAERRGGGRAVYASAGAVLSRRARHCSSA
jgi:hypothetical protein